MKDIYIVSLLLLLTHMHVRQSNISAKLKFKVLRNCIIYCTCILVPGGKTTGLLIKLMYMLGVTVKVTVISRLLTAERYTGMDSLLGKFSSVNENLALKKPRRAEMKKSHYFESLLHMEE